jgi:hypothetical protein
MNETLFWIIIFSTPVWMYVLFRIILKYCQISEARMMDGCNPIPGETQEQAKSAEQSNGGPVC